MSINTLYLHSQFYEWKDSNILPINHRNFKSIAKSSAILDYHACLEDLTFEKTLEAIDSSTSIIVLDYNLKFPDLDGYQYGRLYNHLYANRHKVSGLDFLKNIELENLNLLETKSCDNPILWIYGCSITKGTGVTHDQKYSSLLSKMLNTPIKDQSKGGSSTVFMADKILRSDLRSGDKVVWGLTNLGRFEYAYDWELHSTSIQQYSNVKTFKNNVNIEFLDSMSHMLPTIHNIVQVINYCNKIGVDLYLVNLLDSTWLTLIFKKEKNYIDLSGKINYNGITEFLDYGTDNLHPGPKQHSYYAEQIYKFIKGNKHGKTI